MSEPDFTNDAPNCQCDYCRETKAVGEHDWVVDSMREIGGKLFSEGSSVFLNRVQCKFVEEALRSAYERGRREGLLAAERNVIQWPPPDGPLLIDEVVERDSEIALAIRREMGEGK